jgi:hypothetical protein
MQRLYAKGIENNVHDIFGNSLNLVRLKLMAIFLVNRVTYVRFFSYEFLIFSSNLSF